MKKQSVGKLHKKIKKPQPKAKKYEVIRVDVTMLVSDRRRIINIQRRCERDHRSLNRSEVIRAGLVALEEMSDKQLQAIADKVPQL